MKSRLLIICSYVIIIMLIFASVADAQLHRRPLKKEKRPMVQATSIGIRFGNDFKHDQLLLGGHLWLPIGIFWKLAPGFEYYFVDKEDKYDRWQFNADFMFKPRPRYPFYLGGGLAINYTIPEDMDKETKVGGNAVVGLDFGRIRMPSMYPYIQARWTFIEKENYFSLLGGINFILR